MLGDHTVLWRRRTACSDAAIVDVDGLGVALFLDGVLQSAAIDEARYHQALVGPGLRHLAPTGPRDVLVLGAGEGATIREVLRVPSVEHVLAVDFDAELLAAARQYLSQWHAGAFDDPRVEVRIEDARVTLRKADDDAFDLVIADLTDPPDAPLGPPSDEAPLLELDLVRSMRRVLRPGGVLVLQAGAAEHPDGAGVISPIPTIERVFSHVHVERVFIESFDCEWQFVCAWY